MPLPLGFILGAAVAGGQFAASTSQANAQNRYRRSLAIRQNEQYLKNVQYQKDLMAFYTKRYEQTASSAMMDADQQYSTIFDAINQRRRQAGETLARNSRQTSAAAARYRTKDTFTTGQSKMLAQQEFENIEARAATIIHDNLEGAMRQSQRQLYAINAQAQNRINQAMPQPMQPLYPGDQVQAVYQPGGADLALSLGNVFASSYAQSAARLPAGADVGTILGGMA